MYSRKIKTEPSVLEKKLEEFDPASISLTTRLIVALTLVGLLVIAAGFIYFQSVNHQVLIDRINDRKGFLHNEIRSQVEEARQICLTNATAFASNRELRQALAEGNRKLAGEALAPVDRLYRDNSRLKDIRVHLYTPSQESFIRSGEAKGDKEVAGPVRSGLREVATSRKGTAGFALGRDGLAMRGIVPLVNKDKLVGLVEFLQGMTSVANRFASQHRLYLILVSQEAIKKTGSTSQGTKIWDFAVADDSWFNQATIEFARTLDYQKLQDQGYLLVDGHFVTSMPLTDLRGKVIGIQVAAEPDSQIFGPLEELRKTSSFHLSLLALFVLVVNVLLAVTLKLLIARPVSALHTGMEGFARFLRGDVADIKPVIATDKGEVGSLVKRFNALLEEAREIILRQQPVVENDQADQSSPPAESADLAGQLENLYQQVQSSEDREEMDALATACRTLIARLEEDTDTAPEAEAANQAEELERQANG